MEIKKWKGLKNITGSERIGAGFLEAADNVDIDDSARVISRAGQDLVASGVFHSLWADGPYALIMSGQDQYRIEADLSRTYLQRLTTGRPVSYCRQLNTVYFSNGVDTGRLFEGSPWEWGVRAPRGNPVAASAAGALPAGTYQYAMTFVRSDGAESGTSVASTFELDAQGGIRFSGMEVSTDPLVSGKIVYMSTPNGVELFRAFTVPASATTAVYRGDGSDLTIRLETALDDVPPPGDIVEVYNGIAYVADGSTVWHSRPYQMERFCRATQFLSFPGPVRLFAAVNDGIFVGTDEATWFLAGTGPDAFSSRKVLDYGAIPGAAAKTTIGLLMKKQGEDTPDDPGGMAVLWTTPNGVCAGADGGRVMNMTEGDYSFPTAARGRSMVRQDRGYTTYLTTLEGEGAANNQVS